MSKSDGKNRKKLNELIRDTRIGMLTTMTADGSHHSRPMGMQEIDDDGNLWLFTFSDSDKAAEIAAQPNINLSFSDKGANSWVSIAGSAELVQDKQKIEQLWNPWLKAWFPDGTDTPNIALIRVHAESAEYWDAPNSKVVQLVGTVKAVITGKQPDIGENEEVNLDK